jgi:hypothetical protein
LTVEFDEDLLLLGGVSSLGGLLLILSAAISHKDRRLTLPEKNSAIASLLN